MPQIVFFAGNDNNNNSGLWVTDGTAPGTHELTGIVGEYPGGVASLRPDNKGGLHPADLMAFNGKVFFNGLDDNGQSGLWVTDGTAAGTHELIINGAYSVAYSFYTGFTPFCDRGSRGACRGLRIAGGAHSDAPSNAAHR